MRTAAISLIYLLTLLPLSGQDLGYDTVYYYDLYGSQVADYTPKKLHFAVPWKQTISPQITGPYKQRVYKEGKLTVTVWYKRPELKAVAVEYRLPHAWTEDQLSKALAVYSVNWGKPEEKHKPGGVFSGLIRNKVLMSEEGHYAHLSPYINRLIILSPDILKEFDKKLAEWESKRKAVPEF